MKGVVLAGGLGSRLLPMTAVTNKHLLPVFDRPMIFFPVQTLIESGIRDIVMVVGGDHAGGFLKLLGDGRKMGARRLYYAYQEGEGGIADALSRAEAFADGESICVILGDNIFERSLAGQVARFEELGCGARLLLKAVPDPERFGVAEVAGARVTRIVEKPTRPTSNLAVVGAYFYDRRVCDIIKTLRPSGRGELEITDVNNAYLNWGELTYDMVDGWWADAGTPDSLLHVANLVAGKAGQA
jgi:glucose-1-phosphate thymidylyltransferase